MIMKDYPEHHYLHRDNGINDEKSIDW